MKVSKEQLREIIKEELNELQKEGEIEEGFLDFLSGKGSSDFGGFVTDEQVKEKVNTVVNSLADLVRTASKQENPRLADKAAQLKQDAMGLSVMATPKGPKMIDSSKISDVTLANLRNDLTSNKKTGTPRLKAIYNKLFHGKPAPEERSELINKIMSAIKSDKDFEMVNSELYGTGSTKSRKTAGRTGLGGYTSKFEEE
jgi:hypothetical protein